MAGLFRWPQASRLPGVFRALSTERAAPWLRSFHGQTLAAVRSLPIDALRHRLTQESIRRGLVTGLGRPLAFVPQESLPHGVAYESWIAETGCVPTRDNLHDRYNALLWLSAPRTKARLNALQAKALCAPARHDGRGSLRDAATIWDENLSVIAASAQSDVLIAALRTHDWAMLFGRLRGCWERDWHVMVFGHALLEKLELPFKSITAHVVVLPTTMASPTPFAAPTWAGLDAPLAAMLRDAMSPAMFCHLPVMGIPGWDAANANPVFYQDPQVFRPARR
jgi:hypothetical protein